MIHNNFENMHLRRAQCASIFESHNDRFEKQQKQQVERGPIDSFCYLAINIEYKEMTSWKDLDIYVYFKHVTL